jgi:UDP-N-acetylglucosamine/UDP-N-acetylgalactosamine diphosphorylase
MPVPLNPYLIFNTGSRPASGIWQKRSCFKIFKTCKKKFNMKHQCTSKIEKLLQKGVKVPNPQSIEIGPEVDTDRISGDGVIIHAGCKLYGGSTLILRGTTLGHEGPVIIENCQLGSQVELKAGFFSNAVFLKKSVMGSGSNVREGTILEEESSAAHTVGLKQTILFPFVTLGSLINFCDCLMSGGTSRKNHSEVGSSYIHFNYTPNQDKATPSLFGDVPRGVMLNQRPIFLGGQGGIVGPCRLEFGTVTAAGSIVRKDELRPSRLLIGNMAKGGSMPFSSGVYYNIKRITVNNIIYIANLMALEHWYAHVRSQFISDDFPKPLFDGLQEKLDMAIGERIHRLKVLSQKMFDSVQAYQSHKKGNESYLVLQQKNELLKKWSEMEEYFKSQRNAEENKRLRDVFLKKLDLGIKTSGKDYILVIKGLSVEDAKAGTDWLQAIVDHITAGVLKIIPSFC